MGIQMNQPHQNENHPRPAAARLVMLSSRDAEDVSRLLGMLASSSTSEVVLAAGAPRAVTRSALVQAAEDELINRRRRSAILPEGLFGEPAWEVLLTLYVQQHAARMPIHRLTRGITTPPTTVLRWLNYLNDKDLVRREAHPSDQRSVIVELTDTAIKALDSYFATVLTKEN